MYGVRKVTQQGRQSYFWKFISVFFRKVLTVELKYLHKKVYKDVIYSEIDYGTKVASLWL